TRPSSARPRTPGRSGFLVCRSEPRRGARRAGRPAPLSAAPLRSSGGASARAAAAACRQPARGAGAAVASSSEPLPRLPVQRVATAPAAVLAELDAVGRVSLRLLRLVVPAPALGASERDCDSDSGCHFLISLPRDSPSSAGWARTTDLCIMSAAL